MEEKVILVDEHDCQIGTEEKLTAHLGSLRHRAFSIFIFSFIDGEKRLLLHKRQINKYHSGGLWTNTCCGHPRPGEDIISASQRRLREEMGITAELLEAGTFSYEACLDHGIIENEIDHVMVGYVDPALKFDVNVEEVSDYRWIGYDELMKELELMPEKFTVWFRKALEKVKTVWNE